MRRQRTAMVNRLAQLLLEPPLPPAEFRPVHIFRPSPRLRTYSLIGWWTKQLLAFAGLVLALFFGEFFLWPDWLGWLDELNDELRLDSIFMSSFPQMLARFMLVAGGIGYAIRSIFSFADAWLKLRTHTYMLGEDGLYIREGFQHVHELTIRFANIQQVTLKQNPLQRYFGIADVVVQTAGGTGKAGDGDIGSAEKPGHLAVFRSVDDAEALRDMLRERIGKLTQQSQQAPEQPRSAQPAPDVVEAAEILLSEAQALRKAFRSTNAATRPSEITTS